MTGRPRRGRERRQLVWLPGTCPGIVAEGNSLLGGPGLRRRLPGGQWAGLLAWTARSPTLAMTRRLAGRSPPLRRQSEAPPARSDHRECGASPVALSGSVVCTGSAQGCLRGCSWTSPLRHRAARRAPGGRAVRVRAPIPAWLAARGPSLRVDLPRLAASVRRHVEQGERPAGRLRAPAGRAVGEEHALAVAQEATEIAHVAADRLRRVADRIPRLGVAHELDERDNLIPPTRGEHGE